MKRVLFAAGMALALGATPIAAQTVSVAVGFGVPRPYLTGVVIVGRPYVHHAPWRAFYHQPPLFMPRRVYVVRRRHHHRRSRYDYDCDDD